MGSRASVLSGPRTAKPSQPLQPGLARHERHPRKSKGSVRSRRDRSTADEYAFFRGCDPVGIVSRVGNSGGVALCANPRLLWLRWLRIWLFSRKSCETGEIPNLH